MHVEVGFEVTSLRGNQHITVAASRRSNELRLFQPLGPVKRMGRMVRDQVATPNCAYPSQGCEGC